MINPLSNFQFTPRVYQKFYPQRTRLRKHRSISKSDTREFEYTHQVHVTPVFICDEVKMDVTGPHEVILGTTVTLAANHSRLLSCFTASLRAKFAGPFACIITRRRCDGKSRRFSPNKKSERRGDTCFRGNLVILTNRAGWNNKVSVGKSRHSFAFSTRKLRVIKAKHIP